MGNPVFLDELRAGTLGIEVGMPDAYRVQKEQERSATLFNNDTGVECWLFLFEGLPLRLTSQWATLYPVRAADYARAMFVDASRQVVPDQPLRTDDSTWSPLVEFSITSVQTVRSAQIVHRMVYARGNEVMMGHLLVPLRGGLFEARVVSRASVTGFRESALLASLPSNQLNERGFPKEGPTFYDRPEHDKMFPKHCLSAVRAGLREVRDAIMHVSAPPPETRDQEVALPDNEAAFAPPPGFAYDGERGAFQRVAFCGTDGVERLLIDVEDRAPRWGLERACVKQVRSTYQDAGIADLTLTVVPRDTRFDGVTIVAEGVGHQGDLRNVSCWFADGRRRLVSLTMVTTAATSAEVLVSELRASAASWRAV